MDIAVDRIRTEVASSLMHALRLPQVTITYGGHTSSHFALYYGFVPHVNPFDKLVLTLEGVLNALPEGYLCDHWWEAISSDELQVDCAWPRSALRVVVPSGDSFPDRAGSLRSYSLGLC